MLRYLSATSAWMCAYGTYQQDRATSWETSSVVVSAVADQDEWQRIQRLSGPPATMELGKWTWHQAHRSPSKHTTHLITIQRWL